MDLPTFLIESAKNLIALLGAIAWPGTVLVVVYLFRLEIKLKIRSLAALEGLGVNAQFANLLTQAEQSAVDAHLRKPAEDALEQKEIPSEDVGESPESTAPSTPLIKTAAASRIIQVTFSDLVAELRKKAGKLGYTPDGHKKRFVKSVVEDLEKHRNMPGALGEMILGLQALKNLAVADPYGVSGDEVIRYLRLAEDAKRGVQKLPDPND